MSSQVIQRMFGPAGAAAAIEANAARRTPVPRMLRRVVRIMGSFSL